MSTMLYSYPRTINSIDGRKGYCKVDNEYFDYIIVDEEEVEACLKEGFSRTSTEALDKQKKEDFTVDEEEVDKMKEAYTVDELKKLAKEHGIKRISSMKEDDLVRAILMKKQEDL